MSVEKLEKLDPLCAISPKVVDANDKLETYPDDPRP
jgi:hypothetical protein